MNSINKTNAFEKKLNIPNFIHSIKQIWCVFIKAAFSYCCVKIG